jgi:hypothetical protein
LKFFLQTFLLLKENENEEMGIASKQAHGGGFSTLHGLL